MLTTVEGVYKDGKIELTEIPEGMEQSQVLVTFLPRLIPLSPPQALYGIGKNRIAADLDVDAALTEIRSEWTQELEAEPHG